MQKNIELQERQIEYTLALSKRAKKMRLAVECGGGLVVTVPEKMSQALVEKFITQKSHWIIHHMDRLKNVPGFLCQSSSRSDFLAYKNEALELARERIAYFNEAYAFTFNNIAIRNQKARWGSCSRKGNLSFNYKIVLLPPRFSDYIIVHELCHLGAFDHSQKFWSLVTKTIPDHFEIRRELRRGKVHA